MKTILMRTIFFAVMVLIFVSCKIPSTESAKQALTPTNSSTSTTTQTDSSSGETSTATSTDTGTEVVTSTSTGTSTGTSTETGTSVMLSDKMVLSTTGAAALGTLNIDLTASSAGLRLAGGYSSNLFKMSEEGSMTEALTVPGAKEDGVGKLKVVKMYVVGDKILLWTSMMLDSYYDKCADYLFIDPNFDCSTLSFNDHFRRNYKHALYAVNRQGGELEEIVGVYPYIDDYYHCHTDVIELSDGSIVFSGMVADVAGVWKMDLVSNKATNLFPLFNGNGESCNLFILGDSIYYRGWPSAVSPPTLARIHPDGQVEAVVGVNEEIVGATTIFPDGTIRFYHGREGEGGLYSYNPATQTTELWLADTYEGSNDTGYVYNIKFDYRNFRVDGGTVYASDGRGIYQVYSDGLNLVDPGIQMVASLPEGEQLDSSSLSKAVNHKISFITGTYEVGIFDAQTKSIQTMYSSEKELTGFNFLTSKKNYVVFRDEGVCAEYIPLSEMCLSYSKNPSNNLVAIDLVTKEAVVSILAAQLWQLVDFLQ